MSARRTINDVGSVATGYDTARVTSDLAPGETERRTKQQAAARGNLAALVCESWGIEVARPDRCSGQQLEWAAAEFRELADILGLNGVPQRAPGTCRGCGTTLPMTVASSHAKGTDYRSGLCWACSHDGPAPAVVETPPVRVPDDDARPYHGGEGHCEACDRDYVLDGEGRLRRHHGWETRAGGVRVRVAQWCAGSGGWPGGRPPP